MDNNDTDRIDEKLDELLSELRSGTINFDAYAKQAIKQLVADEMLELIGDDLQPLPNGYMPESHDNVNNRLAIQRAKLAEWRRSK